LSEEEILKEALRKGLLRTWRGEGKNHGRKVGQYYPSGIGSCLRKQYYDFVSPKPPTPEELAIFATGKGIHEAVADALQNSGVVSVDRIEMPVSLQLSKEVTLTGRVDILLAKMMGREVIVEVKSSSHLPQQPHENHVMQLQTYLHALNLELGLLLYWDKRTGQISSFRVERDASWLNKIGERTFILDAHLRAGRVPLREAFVMGKYWECDYCPYLAECDPFNLNGVEKGASLAMVGVSAIQRVEGGGYSLEPDLVELKEIVKQLKKNGQTVCVLGDFPDDSGKDTTQLLKTSGVNYDVIITKPLGYSSGRTWKAELAKRLATKYRITTFVDNDESVLEHVRRIAETTLSLKPGDRGR
jgi:hypothetical protein